MNARIVLIAFAWIAALVGLAAAFQGSGSPHPARPMATDTRARDINAAQGVSDRRWQWSVRSTTSATRAMVVTVEAFDVGDARRIAAAIVEPRRAQFDDILVYVHRVGGSRDLAARRVEWTPRGGYVEIVYEK